MTVEATLTWLPPAHFRNATMASARNWLDRPFRYGYTSQMKSATITEVKNQLSAIIDRVKAGESVVVTDRGQPVATIFNLTVNFKLE